jgi:hypothetical protein
VDKKYSLIVTQNPDGVLHFECVNEGFGGFEIAGFLAFKLMDVHAQLDGKITPMVINRTVIKEERHAVD